MTQLPVPKSDNITEDMRPAPRPLSYKYHQKLRNQMMQSLVQRDLSLPAGDGLGRAWKVSVRGNVEGLSRQRIGGGGVFRVTGECTGRGNDQGQVYRLVHSYKSNTHVTSNSDQEKELC